MEANEELLQGVKSAVRQVVAALRDQHPRESLAGYALLTDDDLGSLTNMAITREALLASGGGDDLLFSPTDWPYDHESASLESTSRRLREMGAASEHEQHVEVAFASMVQALAELRADGLFSPEVFLSVLSTDPGPFLEALEKASVERLNRMDLVEARERFLERWAGSSRHG
jgi:hypothetical protein